MRRALILMSVGCLLACGRPDHKGAAPPPDPQVVATWDGGRATLAEVEGVLVSLPPEERMSREGDIVKTYQEVARERALAQILLPKGPRTEQAALEGRAPELYQQTLAQIYSRDAVLRGRDLVVGEDEVKAFYEGRRAQFHRKRRVLLSNILRRSRPGEDPGAAAALLASLRKRVLAGERFAELARANSDSETRATGGQVGWIERGAMAPQLDRIVFSLKEGEVSEPVSVPSGALLLYAERVVPEKSYSYEDVRVEIHRQLERTKVRDALESWARDVKLPEGSLVLSKPELVAALASGGDEQPLVRILDATLTRGQFKQSLPQAAQAPPEGAQTWELYRQRFRQQLLLAEARRTGFAERPEVRAELERLLKRYLERKAVEERLDARLKGDLAPADKPLRAFYDEHPQRYQSPLKLRLRVLSVDKASALGRQLREMEGARQELLAGKLTLEEAARRLGGRVEEIGWREVMRLEPLDDKERRYVLDLKSTGYTVSYRHEGSLRLLQVAERQEPVRRPYEQARDDVRTDYLKEKRKELLDGAVERVLKDARFHFFEDRVRMALALTTPATPAAAAAPKAGGAPTR